MVKTYKNPVDIYFKTRIMIGVDKNKISTAGVAELADAQDLKSCGT